MNFLDTITIDTPAHRRVDELVNAAGVLEGMREAAEANGELALAEHLRRALEAALARLGAIDADLAAGWREVHQSNVRDREDLAEELCSLAGSRFFTKAAQSVLRRAAASICGEAA